MLDYMRARRQVSISSLVLRTLRTLQILDDMRARANYVCLLGLWRSDRHVLALLLCAGLIALRCAVLAVDARQHARIYIMTDTK